MRQRKPQRWDPLKEILLPSRWRDLRIATLTVDPFDPGMDFALVDTIWAAMASASEHAFVVETAYPERYREWLERVKSGAVHAAAAHEAKMRAHFARHKEGFTDGYTLPPLPTPELRFIYDSARRRRLWESTDLPRSQRGRVGFPPGEYHWQRWPLSNVRVDDLTNPPEEWAGLLAEALRRHGIYPPDDPKSFTLNVARDLVSRVVPPGGEW